MTLFTYNFNFILIILFSYYFHFTLKILRLYSSATLPSFSGYFRIILTLFFHYFILLQLYSHNNLNSYYNFILIIIYSRTRLFLYHFDLLYDFIHVQVYTRNILLLFRLF